VPKRDDTLVNGDYRLTVLEANAERPRRVRVERITSEGKRLVANFPMEPTT
jgi:CBS domain containing-hemolysin-like protein